MKVIAKLAKTETRPEEMRVVHDGQWFLVQTLNKNGVWVSQKEHDSEESALNDCLTWYN